MGNNHLRQPVIKKNPVFKYVKIHESRGYGNGIWKITKEEGSEYHLISFDKQKVTIYKAHCYEDKETRKCNMDSIKGLPVF